MDLPLESIHKFAFKAAEAARCAGEQGKFWEMHDRLFANQTSLEPAKPHAEAVGLDVPKFEGCLSSGKYAEAVRKAESSTDKKQKPGWKPTELYNGMIAPLIPYGIKGEIGRAHV